MWVVPQLLWQGKSCSLCIFSAFTTLFLYIYSKEQLIPHLNLALTLFLPLQLDSMVCNNLSMESDHLELWGNNLTGSLDHICSLNIFTVAADCTADGKIMCSCCQFCCGKEDTRLECTTPILSYTYNVRVLCLERNRMKSLACVGVIWYDQPLRVKPHQCQDKFLTKVYVFPNISLNCSVWSNQLKQYTVTVCSCHDLRFTVCIWFKPSELGPPPMDNRQTTLTTSTTST